MHMVIAQAQQIVYNKPIMPFIPQERLDSLQRGADLLAGQNERVERLRRENEELGATLGGYALL